MQVNACKKQPAHHVLSALVLAHLQAGMRWLESAYPDKARGWVGFNVPMSHKITAACDLLLMPSRFEPCGLNQLYAMRYGTVPVAHATGGLRDTVLPFNPWEGMPLCPFLALLCLWSTATWVEQCVTPCLR